MEWSEIEAGWPTMREVARSRWSRVTDGDLEKISGDRTSFVQRLQDLYGITREEAEIDIESWRNSLKLDNDRSRLLDEIERLKIEVSKFAKIAGDEVRDGADQASAKANEFAKELESAIERNPMQAALIAAGIGLIIGLLSRPNR